MQVSTRAFVFSAVKYAEADLIVSCFTEEYGLKSYLLRGILKSRKGKLRASMFQPLTQLQLEAFHKNKGTLERIQEAKVIQPYQSLQTEVVKSSLLLFLSEVLKNSVKEEETNIPLYQFISKSLYWLDDHNEIAAFHLLFLLKLSGFLGFYPDFTEKDCTFFHLQEGVFQNLKQEYCQQGPHVEAIKWLHGKSYENLYEKKIPKEVRMELLQLLLNYYQLHLQGFRIPKSLPVLQQVFH